MIVADDAAGRVAVARDLEAVGVAKMTGSEPGHCADVEPVEGPRSLGDGCCGHSGGSDGGGAGLVGSTGRSRAVAHCPRSRRMPRLSSSAAQGVLPIATITSGSTSAI